MADGSIPNEGGSAGNNNEGGQNQSGKGSQGASEVDLSKITTNDFAKLLDRDDIKEALMGSESVRREIQSQKDRELAREGRKRLEDQRVQANAESARLDIEEKRQLIADGDAEALLKRESAKLEKDKTDSESASRVGRIIEDTVKNSPEFQSLGEDRIQEIYSETSRVGGTVVDFTTALSREKTKQAVEAASVESASTLEAKVNELLDLKMQEAGLIKRSEAAKSGDSPSENISDGTVNRANIRLDSKEEISLAYGAGEITTKQFTKKMEQFNTED